MPASRRRCLTLRYGSARTHFGIVLAAATAGVTACSGPLTEQPTPPTTATTATTDANPSQPPTGRLGTASAAAVLDAYRRFWAVAAGVGRQPETEWRPRLELVTTDPFLSALLKGLAEQQRRGVVDFGTVQLRPTVAALTPTRASILDCQDASRTGEVDRDTGEVTSVGSSRTAFTATLTRDPAGRWRVAQARYLPDPC